MSILVACRCGHEFRVKDKYAGMEGKCPACGGMIQVPSQAPAGSLQTLSAAKTLVDVPLPTVAAPQVALVDPATERARVALAIQRAMLPRQPPELAACEVAGVVQPADITGGDYYDFFPLQDGSLALAIGDAAGHGLGAALLMGEARICLRALAQAYSDVGTVFTLTNRVFAAGMPDDIYATLTLARLDLNTRLLSYASAGHPTGYVFDIHGKVKWNLESTDCPLGLLAQTIYGTSSPLRLEAGELVLFVTNGIVKSRAADGTLFGVERIWSVVEANHRQPVKAIAETLCQAARSFSGNQTDDLTAMVMRIR